MKRGGAEFADPEARATYEEYLALRRELGRTGPVTLMDLATVNAKYLKSKGMLDRLDESEEVNACTVKIDVELAKERLKDPEVQAEIRELFSGEDGEQE